MIIRIQTAGKSEREFTVEKYPVSIGRSSKNDIAVQDPCFSRKHCIIEETKKGYRVKDLDSKNGIKVNGQSVKASDVMNGDVITIGTHDFILSDKKKKEKDAHKAVNDGKKKNIQYKGDAVPESVWKEQLKKEMAAECEHCGTYFSIAHPVPGVGLFCPNCRTKYEK